MINFIETEQSITLQDYEEFKKETEVSLPASYKKHILQNNGGKPTLEMSGDLRIHYFHSIKYGESGTLEQTLETIQDVLPDNFFPFAYDEGGNQIGFFLEGDNEGKVYIWYHDMGEEDDLEFLADSFDDFMKGLSKDDY